SFADWEQRVYDYAGLFTEEEISDMENRLDKLRAEYPFDFVVLTIDDAEGKDTLTYADDFYDREDLGFGYGESYAGILYLIDMDNRVPAISTCGDMIPFMDDERVDIILNNVYDSLVEGNYAESAMIFMDLTEGFITGGIPMDQYYYDPETGQEYTYDEGTGDFYPVDMEVPKSLSLGELALGIIVGLLALLIMQLIIRRKYNLKGSTYSYNSAVNSFMNITDHQDQYIHTTETRHRIQSGNHGGGPRIGGGGGTSIRMGSSGRMHGGGAGRRF
ncbi:MAG: TPM domain-containing protein, partial [Firmicutes bacterium]|nr:TPM domain-containing protein [Bacillota bacterium]